MSGRANVTVVGGAVWIAGRWVATLDDLAVRAGEHEVRAEVPIAGVLGSERLPRADRVTQLGAVALGRALAELPARDPEGVSVLTASTMATAYTNERFERRRMEGKAPEPRAFPFTAPNAGAGEMAIAVAARGPTLALVGGAEVALAAVERAVSWIAQGLCVRACIVATECPPQSPSLVAPPGVVPVECAAAIVLERAHDPSQPRLTVRWSTEPAVDAHGAGALLSVDALARVVLASRGLGEPVVAVRSSAGAALQARLLRD